MPALNAVPIQISNQPYLPVHDRRELEPEELQLIAEKSRRWMPRISPGFAAKLVDLLGSPAKAGLLTGAGFGAVGGLLGGGGAWSLLKVWKDLSQSNVERAIGPGLASVVMKIQRNPVPTIAITAVGLGLLLGVPGGVRGYLDRRQRNEDVLEMIARNPPGATLRDGQSDPLANLYGGTDVSTGWVKPLVASAAGTALAAGVATAIADSGSSQE